MRQIIMEILGVGSGEVIAIVIIMLVVAGPKRMVQWAYVLGQYVSKARDVWGQVMAGVQKEFDDAGLDVQLPKSMPTRASLNNLANPMNNIWANVTAPVQEVMNDVSSEIKQTQSELRDAVQEEKVAS
jgi:Sec-independent protein translocase protein TatA